MLRMEIALLLVTSFIAYTYFAAEKEQTPLHQTFSVLLAAVMVHLALDGATVYTVNHLDSVPPLFSGILHRLFLGSTAAVIFLFYRYIAILIQEETGSPRRSDRAAVIFLIMAELGSFLLPISYTVTAEGNYSSGPYLCRRGILPVSVCCGAYVQPEGYRLEEKGSAIGAALFIEFTVCLLQGLHHTWLISGMGITLMTLSFYLTLENPEALRAELVGQKLSMLYLKSQVNPHFLYNTLDTIRIQAELNGDKQVSALLMRLAGFFRLSIKADRPMVALDDEIELLEAYMELMCSRYPDLKCRYDIDPELGGAQVPNFILQPIVENSLRHGLKNKGYRGEVSISAKRMAEGRMEISVMDTGGGFAEGKKEAVDAMLLSYASRPPKLTGSSIGILNVQKRIKLLCGRDYGLSYTENEAEA